MVATCMARADLGDGLDHAAIHDVGGDVRGEVAVDLEEIHRQRLQVHERGHAAAEIIEREAAAARLELAHEERRLGEAGDRRGLGDLEAQRARHLFIAQPRQHELEEILVVDRGARQVDGHQRQAPALARCSLQQLDGAVDHPAVHHDHHVVALGGRDEFVRAAPACRPRRAGAP